MYQRVQWKISFPIVPRLPTSSTYWSPSWLGLLAWMMLSKLWRHGARLSFVWYTRNRPPWPARRPERQGTVFKGQDTTREERYFLLSCHQLRFAYLTWPAEDKDRIAAAFPACCSRRIRHMSAKVNFTLQVGIHSRSLLWPFSITPKKQPNLRYVD